MHHCQQQLGQPTEQNSGRHAAGRSRRALKGDTKVACLLGVGGLEQLASARARGLLKCSNALLQVVVGRQHHCQGDVSGSRRLQQAPTGSCRGLTIGCHATA